MRIVWKFGRGSVTYRQQAGLDLSIVYWSLRLFGCFLGNFHHIIHLFAQNLFYNILLKVGTYNSISYPSIQQSTLQNCTTKFCWRFKYPWKKFLSSNLTNYACISEMLWLLDFTWYHFKYDVAPPPLQNIKIKSSMRKK